MKPVRILLLTLALCPSIAAAQVPVTEAPVTEAPVVAPAASPAGPFPAAEVALEAQLYTTRPVVVFADSETNPNFIRQKQLIEREIADLAERDVVVIYDTDPEAKSEWRQRLRPRGFSLVILDKDLRPVSRNPSPTNVRDITRSIDLLPSRRQEVLERFGAGR